MESRQHGTDHPRPSVTAVTPAGEDGDTDVSISTSSDDDASPPATDAAPPANGVDALDQGSSGRWVVTTRTSRHVWDFDQMTYLRLRGPSGPVFDNDGVALDITHIGIYPAVGGSSLMFYDDPDNEAVQRWRQSATIVSITAHPEGTFPSA